MKFRQILQLFSFAKQSRSSIWLSSGESGRKEGANNNTTTAITKLEKLNLSYYCFNPKYLIENPKNITPIVAIHGMFMSKDFFVPFAPLIAKKLKRPVYVVDLRNHGESAHRNFDGKATLAIMAQDVLNFMDEFSIPKAIFLGQGLGGRVAVQAAQMNHERCEKIVAIDISQDGEKMFTKSFPRYLYYLDETGMNKSNSSLSYARLVMKQILKSHIKNQFALKFFLENIRETRQGNYQWRFNAKTLNTMLHNWPKVKKINYGSKADFNIMSIVTKSNFITSEDYLDLRRNFEECKVEYVGSRYIFSNSLEFLNKLEKFIIEK